MRIAACLALALLPLVTVFACGGRVGGDLPDGGGSSSSGGSGSSSGGQGCPAPAVKSNIACSPDGLTCPADVTVTDCNGNANETTVDCICHWGHWYCDAPPSQPMCPMPPTHECPAAQSIVPNSGCNAPGALTCASATPDYDCESNFAGYLQCNCNLGTWFCPVPDAGTTLCNCPPLTSIQAGAPCRPLIATCPGGTPWAGEGCPGGRSYSEFSCEKGVWVDLGYGTCIVDAGAGG